MMTCPTQIECTVFFSADAVRFRLRYQIKIHTLEWVMIPPLLLEMMQYPVMQHL